MKPLQNQKDPNSPTTIENKDLHVSWDHSDHENYDPHEHHEQTKVQFSSLIHYRKLI